MNYGKYLTSAEVAALTAASDESVSAATSFFEGADCGVLGDSLNCTAPVGVLSSLLHTKFYNMASLAGAGTRPVVSHLGPMSIPAELAPHIVFVAGLSFFPERSVSHSRPLKVVGDDDGPSPAAGWVVRCERGVCTGRLRTSTVMRASAVLTCRVGC